MPGEETPRVVLAELPESSAEDEETRAKREAEEEKEEKRRQAEKEEEEYRIQAERLKMEERAKKRSIGSGELEKEGNEETAAKKTKHDKNKTKDAKDEDESKGDTDKEKQKQKKEKKKKKAEKDQQTEPHQEDDDDEDLYEGGAGQEKASTSGEEEKEEEEQENDGDEAEEEKKEGEDEKKKEEGEEVKSKEAAAPAEELPTGEVIAEETEKKAKEEKKQEMSKEKLLPPKVTFRFPTGPPGATESSSSGMYMDDKTMLALSMKRLLELQATRKPFSGEIADALTFSEMKEHAEAVMDVEDRASHMSKWELAVDISKGLMNAVSATAAEIMSHIKNRRAEEERGRKKAESRREAEALAKAQETAVEKANDIKSRMSAAQGLSSKVASVFSLPVANFGTKVTVLDSRPRDKKAWLSPFLVQGEAVDLFLGIEKVQKGMTDLVKSTRKRTAQSTTRHQTPLDAKKGKEEATEFFNNFMPEGVLKLNGIDGGSQFTEAVWACAANKGMTFAGFCPNQAAMLRVLGKGTVNMLMVETSSLVDCSCSLVGPGFESLDYLETDVPRWTAEKVCAWAHVHAVLRGGPTIRCLSHHA